MGQVFDVETLETVGPPVTLLPLLAIFGGGASQFAVSHDGTLLYSVPMGAGDIDVDQPAMIWLDLEGNPTPYVIVNDTIVVRDSEVLADVFPGQPMRYPVEAEGRYEPLDVEGWVNLHAVPLIERDEGAVADWSGSNR